MPKMNPLSLDLGNALLSRHKRICLVNIYEVVSEKEILQAVISYRDLLIVIGAPESLAPSIGGYLAEVAGWCKERKLPPINALAVNGKLHRPGPGYYVAPGCGDWDAEVRACIACRDYPALMPI